MNTDLAEYLRLKQQLLKRKAELERELAAINRALADIGPAAVPERCCVREYGVLTEAVKKSLRGGPRTKDQILADLHAQKFPFNGPPREVLDSVLYTKHFQRAGKLFRLA